jgi:hypothetical protein
LRCSRVAAGIGEWHVAGGVWGNSMRGLFGLIVMGTIAFFGYGFYDAYALKRVPQATVQTVVDTWHQLRYDSWDFWGAGLNHGNVIIKLQVYNPSPMLIRQIVLHADAMQNGKLLERVDAPCQFQNSIHLAMPAETNFQVVNFAGNDMVCFVKLQHDFPFDPKANDITYRGDDMDRERERVWALVRSVTLDHSWVDIQGTNRPMNAVVWLEDQWKSVSTGFVNAVTYPFQRA